MIVQQRTDVLSDYRDLGLAFIATCFSVKVCPSRHAICWNSSLSNLPFPSLSNSLKILMRGKIRSGGGVDQMMDSDRYVVHGRDCESIVTFGCLQQEQEAVPSFFQ